MGEQRETIVGVDTVVSSFLVCCLIAIAQAGALRHASTAKLVPVPSSELTELSNNAGWCPAACWFRAVSLQSNMSSTWDESSSRNTR